MNERKKPQPPEKQQSDDGIERAELIIAKSLKIGVLLSSFIIGIGLILFLITGQSGYPQGAYPTDFSAILQGLIAMKSYAIILAGLFLLILTPVFRVGISILIFLKEKDRLYVFITTLVFTILIISFLLGKIE